MRVILIFFLSITIVSCDWQMLNTPEEKHGEPRVFTHPETGLEYYYEVPGGSIFAYNMPEFCETLDFDGAGWRWANIDDLRELVTGCPNVMPDGKCCITDENHDWKYYDNGECGCYGEESENNDDDLSTISLLHDADTEKECGVIISSTADTYWEDLESRYYYDLFFCNGGSIYRVSAKQVSDIICVRDPE